jgi:hypothetical protein
VPCSWYQSTLRQGLAHHRQDLEILHPKIWLQQFFRLLSDCRTQVLEFTIIVPLTRESEWEAQLEVRPRWQSPRFPTLVSAPHPDDETLAAGGPISFVRSEHRFESQLRRPTDPTGIPMLSAHLLDLAMRSSEVLLPQ